MPADIFMSIVYIIALSMYNLQVYMIIQWNETVIRSGIRSVGSRISSLCFHAVARHYFYVVIAPIRCKTVLAVAAHCYPSYGVENENALAVEQSFRYLDRQTRSVCGFCDPSTTSQLCMRAQICP